MLHIQSWKKPMSSRKFNQKRERRSAGFTSTYQDMGNSTEAIDEKEQKRIQNILKMLTKIGKPLEFPEKNER